MRRLKPPGRLAQLLPRGRPLLLFPRLVPPSGPPRHVGDANGNSSCLCPRDLCKAPCLSANRRPFVQILFCSYFRALCLKASPFPAALEMLFLSWAVPLAWTVIFLSLFFFCHFLPQSDPRGFCSSHQLWLKGWVSPLTIIFFSTCVGLSLNTKFKRRWLLIGQWHGNHSN